MKNDLIQVRMNEDEKAEVAALADERDIPVSQFVREAIREKVAAEKLVKETVATTEASQ